MDFEEIKLSVYKRWSISHLFDRCVQIQFAKAISRLRDSVQDFFGMGSHCVIT
jgi:hypothetical protein